MPLKSKNIRQILCILPSACVLLATMPSCSKKTTVKVTWQNYDGTVLKIDEAVTIGSTPSYTGLTPKKEGTERIKYTFDGWDPIPAPVKEDTTYTAQYKSTDYVKIVWMNKVDGDVLETDYIVKGAVPSYQGKNRKKLLKPTSEGYLYFDGWTEEPSATTQDKTYYAKYAETTPESDLDFDGVPDYLDVEPKNNTFNGHLVCDAPKSRKEELNFTFDMDYRFLVNGDNEIYQTDLAKLAVVLSSAAYTHNTITFSSEYEVGGTTPNEKLYSRLGFDNIKHVDLSKYDVFGGTNPNDICSYTLAHHVVDDGIKKHDIIFVIFNNSSKNTGDLCEWSSDVDFGYDAQNYYAKRALTENNEWVNKKHHKGMDVTSRRCLYAPNDAYISIPKYIETVSKHDNSEEFDNTPIVYMTGLSRWGATANLCGKYLEEQLKPGTNEKAYKPFTYTLCSFPTYYDDEKDQYKTIFNIDNTDDAITKANNFNCKLKRYGTDIKESISQNFARQYKTATGYDYLYFASLDKTISLFPAITREKLYSATLTPTNIGSFSSLEKAQKQVDYYLDLLSILKMPDVPTNPYYKFVINESAGKYNISFYLSNSVFLETIANYMQGKISLPEGKSKLELLNDVKTLLPEYYQAAMPVINEIINQSASEKTAYKFGVPHHMTSYYVLIDNLK